MGDQPLRAGAVFDVHMTLGPDGDRQARLGNLPMLRGDSGRCTIEDIRTPEINSVIATVQIHQAHGAIGLELVVCGRR